MLEKQLLEEHKTKKVSFLFKPTLYQVFQKVAAMKQTSPNALIGSLMLECIQQNEDLVQKYDSIYEEE